MKTFAISALLAAGAAASPAMDKRAGIQAVTVKGNGMLS